MDVKVLSNVKFL